MDPASAKLIGAGLAAIGAGLAAIGVGSIFGQYLNGAVRNPEADSKLGGRLIFGFAVTEALGLIAAVVALALAFQTKSGRGVTMIVAHKAARPRPRAML